MSSIFFTRLLIALGLGLAVAVAVTKTLPAKEAQKGDLRMTTIQYTNPEVQGGPPCGPLDFMMGKLEAVYGEVPIMGGIANNGSALIITAGPRDESWTILQRTPEGNTCVMAAGVNLFRRKPAIAGHPL